MKLPLAFPTVVSYLHHANPLSIVEADPKRQDYVAHEFLQLYFRENDAPGVGKEVQIDFYSYDGIYPRYPFLQISWLSAKLIGALGVPLIDFICTLLDEENYIEATVDEFYLSCKAAYKRGHLPHPNLIYGYDKASQLFYCQGFDRNWVYTQLEIPFAELVESFTPTSGMAIIGTDRPLEYSNSRPFSRKLAAQYLQDFIDSKNSFISFNPSQSRFGLATYDAALDKVSSENRDRLDIRPWCVFLEHKAKIIELMRRVNRDLGSAKIEAFMQDYEGIKKDFLGLRNYVVKHKLTRQAADHAFLQQHLQDKREREVRILSEFLELAA